MAPSLALDPLPYHHAVVDYLQTEERALWDWFASGQARADYTESLRLALLKSTYRLESEAHPDLYRGAEAARAALDLDVPLTIYQAQQSGSGLNASLYFMPAEAHLVLTGPLLALLDPAETRAVLGHELAHHVLWRQAGGDFLVADRVLQAIADDPRAAPSHVQTARRYRLYTEVFADRGGLRVAGALEPMVAGLVKMHTGLPQVSAASYLRQADDIFSGRAPVTSAEASHPEDFIRARALRLWAEGGAGVEQDIAAMIAGGLALDELDLLDQRRLTRLTRRLIAQLLRPAWFRTAAVLGHAALFFADVRPAGADDPGLPDELRFEDPKLREYLCYVLLDFAAADPELDELPVAAAWDWSRRLGLDAAFEKLLVSDLGLKPRAVKRLSQQAAELLQRAGA